MSDEQRRVAKADAEAAAWHTRLGSRSITTAAIHEFYAWREDSINAEAYRKVEAFWTKSKGLEGRPGIESALAEAMARKKTSGRRIFLGGVIVATAGVALAIAGALWFQGRNDYATGIGEEQVVQLADGSTVRLDTNSRIRVAFSDDQRTIKLEQGRALFTVAHETARPFIVDAGSAQVRAVGTVFDVRRAPAAVTVSMVSGRVDVTGVGIPQGRTERLSAGQQGRVSAKGVQARTANVTEATSWTEGRLVFRGAPLAEAVAEVNRYLTNKIVLAPSAPKTAALSGVFHTGDRDAFVSAASELFGLRASVEADGSVRLAADKK